MVDSYVLCQIMDQPLKLMEIHLKALGLFMTCYDETEISVSPPVS
jgi:hypothetical protein